MGEREDDEFSSAFLVCSFIFKIQFKKTEAYFRPRDGVSKSARWN